MSFCAMAILAARAFIRRLYDAMSGVMKPHHLVKMTRGTREDLNLWLSFLNDFNGTCYISDFNWTTNESLELFSDSAGNV